MITVSDEQALVIEAGYDRSMLVLACPGSGKTFTLVKKIEHLVTTGCEGGILVLTFTNRAVEDLREKMGSALSDRVDLYTIDAFCLRECLRLDLLQPDSSMLFSADEYKYMLHERIHQGSIDAAVARYKYVFVDEVQDIDLCQYSIIRHFLDLGSFLYLTGDDKQNIYGFRFSSNRFIHDYDTHFPNTDLYLLTRNFRSSVEIVRKLNDLEPFITSRFRYRSKAGCNALSGHVEEIRVSSAQDYGDRILQIIREKNYVPGKCAVLCRCNRYLEDVFVTLEGLGVADLSVHSSKGLEFEHVFFIGANQGIIPFAFSMDIQEELRIFYVGLSRARESLFIMWHGDHETHRTPFLALKESDMCDEGTLYIESPVRDELMLERLGAAFEKRKNLRETHRCTLSTEIPLKANHATTTVETLLAVEIFVRLLSDTAAVMDMLSRFLSKVVPTGVDAKKHAAKYGVRIAKALNTSQYVSDIADNLLDTIDRCCRCSKSNAALISGTDLYTLACCVSYGRSGRVRGFFNSSANECIDTIEGIVTVMRSLSQKTPAMYVYDDSFIENTAPYLTKCLAVCLGNGGIIKVISLVKVKEQPG